MMADILIGSLLLTCFYRSHIARDTAANGPQIGHTGPTASDSPQNEHLTDPVLDPPSVNPSSTIAYPLQIPWDDSGEVTNQALHESDLPAYPPDYSHYEPNSEKGRLINSSSDPTPTPVTGPTQLVSDDTFPQILPVPPRCRLRRGLQVPSRTSAMSWGFELPPALMRAGVGKSQWKTFTHETKRYARMSKTQFFSLVATSWGIGVCSTLVLPGSGFIVSSIYCHRKQKRNEQDNINTAHNSGALHMMTERWNRNYFEALGLQVRLELPDSAYAGMKEMDVSTTRLFKYQQKRGYYSRVPGEDSGCADIKEIRYVTKEGRQRMKAASKCRIVIVPLASDTNDAIAPMNIDRNLQANDAVASMNNDRNLQANDAVAPMNNDRNLQANDAVAPMNNDWNLQTDDNQPDESTSHHRLTLE